MKKFKLPLIAGLSLLTACGGIALAQKPAAEKAPAPANGPVKVEPVGDVVIRNSPQGTSVADYKRNVLRLTKDVVVTQEGEDFILYCDEITFNENTNEAIASGNLRLKSRDSTLTGKRMRADFDTKVITILDDVVLNSYGKGTGVRSTSSPKRKASTMTCDRIDYNYRNRQAIITGNIKMKQENTSGSCERILFDEERNTAELQGKVVFVNNANKRTIRALNATVWIDDEVVQTTNRTTVTTPREKTSRPVAPPANVKPVPQISNDDLSEFGRALPPPPTPAPPAPEETPAPLAPSKPKPESDKQ